MDGLRLRTRFNDRERVAGSVPEDADEEGPDKGIRILFPAHQPVDPFMQLHAELHSPPSSHHHHRVAPRVDDLHPLGRHGSERSHSVRQLRLFLQGCRSFAQ